MNKYRLEIKGWCDFENLYYEMVDKFNDGSVFIEVGCWLGQSAAIMADKIKESGKNIKFYVVDTFKGQSSYQPQIDTVRVSGGNIFYEFWLNMQKYNLHHFITPIISESYDSIKLIKENEIDFVFIDANHEYEYIKKDIQHYWPKIKSGGIMAGHDYNGDVKLAVDEFFNSLNLIVQEKNGKDSCFLVVKP